MNRANRSDKQSMDDSENIIIIIIIIIIILPLCCAALFCLVTRIRRRRRRSQSLPCTMASLFESLGPDELMARALAPVKREYLRKDHQNIKFSEDGKSRQFDQSVDLGIFFW